MATTGRLLAISDLHVNHRENRAALDAVPEHRDDWLIIAGDVGSKAEHLDIALDALAPRFARVIWAPGNHDLWCPPTADDRTRGQARYEELVAICRARNVLTPEDPYAAWPGMPDVVIVPMFLLFDYSFRPADVAIDEAVRWARETGVVSGDEQMIDPAPFASLPEWCHARCDATETRLDALPANARTILINHWPLRYDLARPPRVPRFSVWSGTTRTEEWPRRYRALAVVCGHMHLRTTLWRHGVRHEEVSLGYPRDWRVERGIEWYLREILPGPPDGAHRFAPPRDPYIHSAG